MKPSGRHAGDQQPESIKFLPKRYLDRAQQEIDRLRKENERLQQEAECLRRALEVALRAGKRQAPHSRGNPKANPKRPAGNRATTTAGSHAARPHRRWMNRLRFLMPEHCPHCGGGVEPERRQTKF